MKITKIAASIITMGLAGVPLAHATNGMNLEGYGPVAAAMGGASMAYDNGTAATMNNPATLGLMKEGSSRFDAAIGGLFPSVTSKCDASPCNASPAAGQSADSSATAFYMPAMGYVRKSGQLTYGAGLFSQGGMGTEYASNSFMAAGTGDKVRSEVGVGRFIVPVAYQMDDKITLGGSLDFVWAGMDLMMAVPGLSFADMLPTVMNPLATQTYGSAGGDLLTSFGPNLANGVCTAVGGSGGTTSCLNWARVDFSNNSAFTGQAKGSGFAFKLGGTFKVNSQLTVGTAFHSKTSMGDLTTTAASMTMDYYDPSSAHQKTVLPGSISVHNFQWPQTIAFGAAYQANDQILLVADYKRIGWKDVMKDFSMTFTAGAGAGGMAGKTVDMSLNQNWDDQNVIELGGAYKVSNTLTVRGGVNMANNPVPDKFMNPLFPAIAKNHITGGVGYVLSSASNIDVSFAYVPKSSATNGQGVTVDFGGFSSQFVYSYQY